MAALEKEFGPLAIDNKSYIDALNRDGYVVIPNVLSQEKVEECLALTKAWREQIPNHDRDYQQITTHGIYKWHQAGQQRHSWLIRTDPAVKRIWADVWNVSPDNLIVSFDGHGYMSEALQPISKKIWTHVDQDPGLGFERTCVQGLVALTSNKSKTLVVYERSHVEDFERHFTAIPPTKKGTTWNLIDRGYLELIKEKKRVLGVPAGAMVLWDSRTFHQNNCGSGNEVREVQYVCFMPKNANYSKAVKSKRMRAFSALATTNHFPYVCKSNALQPREYFNSPSPPQIDYDLLSPPELGDLMPEILKLI